MTGKDARRHRPIRFGLFQLRVCVTRTPRLQGRDAVTMVTMDFGSEFQGLEASCRLTGVSAVVDANHDDACEPRRLLDYSGLVIRRRSRGRHRSTKPFGGDLLLHEYDKSSKWLIQHHGASTFWL